MVLLNHRQVIYWFLSIIGRKMKAKTDAVGVCLPLTTAAIRDSEKGIFLSSCLLNIEIPTSPLTNKVYPSKIIYETINYNFRVQLVVWATRSALRKGLCLFLLVLRVQLIVWPYKRSVWWRFELVGAAGKYDTAHIKKCFRLEVNTISATLYLVKCLLAQASSLILFGLHSLFRLCLSHHT